MNLLTIEGTKLQGKGGNSFKKTFPASIVFNYKIWLFPPKIIVCLLKIQKINS